MNLKEIYNKGICPSCNGTISGNILGFLNTKRCKSCELKIYDLDSKYIMEKIVGKYILRWIVSSADMIPKCEIIKIEEVNSVDFLLPANMTEDQVKTVLTFQ